MKTKIKRNIFDIINNFAKILIINELNYNEICLCNNIPVLLFFWSSNCGLSRNQYNILNNIYYDYHGRIKMVCIDTNTPYGCQLCNQYGVTSSPSIIIMRNNQFVNKLVGITNKFEIIQLIENCIY